MINKTRIGARLLAGFGILVLLSLGYSVYSILQMAKLADFTESLYRSPFEVRRSIRDLENDVLKMELLVDQAVSARSEGARSMLAGRIDSIETDSTAEIAILFERFLGDRQAISGIQDSLAQWSSVRDQVLRLAIDGDLSGVASLKSGEYDRLLGVLDSSIQYVKAYSAARARAFYENALAIRDRTLALSIAIMLALALAGILTALLIGQSIRRPMERLIAAVAGIADGDLGSDLRIEGSDEIAKLGALLAGMQEDLRRKADLARRVAGGDLSLGLEPRGPADELGKALSGMLFSLREASASKALAAWVMEGINRASEETRGDLSAEEYAKRALDFVAAFGQARPDRRGRCPSAGGHDRATFQAWHRDRWGTLGGGSARPHRKDAFRRHRDGLGSRRIVRNGPRPAGAGRASTEIFHYSIYRTRA
jgi:methyl-accepting chemotaxis protein